METDVCIVGSGAGGGVLAHALTRAGFSVVVLEKGRPPVRDATAEDELLQVTRNFHQPPLESDGTEVREDPAVPGKPTRVGQAFYLVGGGTVLYAGTSWRLRPKDLTKRSTYGEVAGASLVDWPVGYDELEPWYTMAEKEVGISGVSGEDPTEPPRSADHLLPPLKEDPFSLILSKAAKGLGLRPFHIPTAISSRPNPVNGTGQCQYCGWCSGYTCLFYAKNSMDITLLPKAQKTGRMQLITGASVSRIGLDGQGRARAVIYHDAAKDLEDHVEARVVCLAAGGVQTPRLLLLSRQEGHPEGLANASGLVGRHLMFHIEGRRNGLLPDTFPFEMAKKLGIHDFYFPSKDEDWVNHCSIQSGSRRGPIRYAMSRPGWGEDWARMLRDDFGHLHQLQAMVEDLPLESNRVELDPDRRDARGDPLARIVHRYHEMDRRALTRTLERMGDLLEACGARLIDGTAAHTNVLGGYTYHLMGTCRMGDDPATSVVNRDGRCHQVPNLFVADSSVFPTSAGLNPTLTIQALAFRMADHIDRHRGEFT